MSMKRSYDKVMEDDRPTSVASPFAPMFEEFRRELDEHHDRRERVIKASRDITAASKKIIFALQRLRKLNEPIPSHVSKSLKPHNDIITTQFAAVSVDLQNINTYRYARNITGGIQELMEALTFQRYLETQSLITYDEARAYVAKLGGDYGPILLTPDDYILGVFDMVGELMRFTITAMATSGSVPGGPSINSQNAGGTDKMDVDTAPNAMLAQRTALTDMRQLRAHLEFLDFDRLSPLGKDAEKKMEVMQMCVAKVENAVCGLIIRGRERPNGWMPDEGANREEVVGY